MNKHLIILPILLTSAISLHVLSFYLEEPEQIANNNPIASASPNVLPSDATNPSTQPSANSSKEPVSSSEPVKSGEPANTDPNKSANPTSPKPTDVKVANNNKNAEPNKSNPPKSGEPKASTSAKPSETPKPVASVVPVATPTPDPDKIEMNGKYIKPKDFSEIVKEARMTGGRLDPFLSLKPPDMREIPPIPEDPQEPVVGKSKPKFKTVKIKNKKTGKLETKKIPVPPTISHSSSNSSIPNQVEKTPDPQIAIELERKEALRTNFEINGLISGKKPLAIISVKTKDGKESKVDGVGEEIGDVMGKTVKVIAINVANNTVTISDGKNQVVLSMKGESDN
ncbi:MAG: hypothetical protein U0457_00410 [Candidatus Sericytochromatia bacterium]